jgi:GT2 family glycosyltransferase
MITVCIPVYNTDVRPLVDSLLKQKPIDCPDLQIVVIDDCSAPSFFEKNAELAQRIDFIALPLNIGRSAIRNLFLNYAHNSYLLFLDGDTCPVESDFIKNYVKYLEKDKVDVLFGGSNYHNSKPKRKYLLRWKYSRVRESKLFEDRCKQSFSFKTNNFLIRKDILATNPFNEEIKGYGHEDTFFGFELFKKGIVVNQIDNPVTNPLQDDNRVFIEKTKNALNNLLHVFELSGWAEAFLKQNKLLAFYWRNRNKMGFKLVLFSLNFIKPI